MKNPGIYILTNTVDGMQYVGKDHNLPSRVRDHLSGNAPNCRYIHRGIQKYGRDAFSVEIIQYPRISEDALNAVERWWIQRLKTLSPGGFNLTEGGEGGSPSEETRQKISESISQRVDEGTHNFLGESNPNHDGEVSRRIQKKRIEEGTHHFLDSEFQRSVSKKRLQDGTHNFLGEKNPNHKRVQDGTHPFLGGEVQRRTHKKRLAAGTHHFLGENHPIKRLSKEGRHPRTLKRIKGQWCYIIALSRFWYEIHDYTLKRRAEFLSKDIPDTSNAEQTDLF